MTVDWSKRRSFIALHFQFSLFSVNFTTFGVHSQEMAKLRAMRVIFLPCRAMYEVGFSALNSFEPFCCLAEMGKISRNI